MCFTEIQTKNNSDLGEMNNLEAGILAETKISKDGDPILGNPDGKSYKISGIPTFFIGNREIGYSSIFGAKSFYEFQEIIDEKLNELEGS